MDKSNADIVEELFTKDGRIIIELTNSIETCFGSIEYNFMPDNELLKLRNVENIQYIYWYEMIERIHMIALSSVFRNNKWIKGIITSYSDKNYYSFSSCVRGLIESCADAVYTLEKVPLTMSKNFKDIKLSLEKK